MQYLKILLYVITCVSIVSASSANSPRDKCRLLAEDANWPSISAWAALNSSVGGRLIATVPLASVCHDPTYDEARCLALQDTWSLSQTHIPTPASIVDPLAQNQSCDPYTPRSSPCRLGNYADYAINVTSPAHIAAGLKFAHKNNVRLVIKSTGHDFLGKSTGRGSLGIWVHNLRTLEFFNHTNSIYTGPALKVGPGLQAWEIYEAAAPLNLRVLGGTCPTVAIGGGYSQGGGHSLLSSKYGLSADNILEWEVVLADGSHIVATPRQYSDLYYALSGGGGGTYAVVVSMTVRVFPETSIGIGAVSVSYTAEGISQDTFWAGITAFHNYFPTWVDAGGSVAYTILNSLFFLRPLTFPDKTVDEIKVLVAPFVADLNALNITIDLKFTSFPNLLEHFDNYFGPLPFGLYGAAQVQGGRLIPRSFIASNRSSELTSVMRNIAANGDFMLVGFGLDVSRPALGKTGLNPYWRETITRLMVQSFWDFSMSWDSQVAKQKQLTDSWIPALENLTPEKTATYLNEGDPHQPNWKAAFYGDQYNKLRAIKKSYDPDDLFYAPTAVGSDEWVVGGDGRLCKSS